MELSLVICITRAYNMGTTSDSHGGLSEWFNAKQIPEGATDTIQTLTRWRSGLVTSGCRLQSSPTLDGGARAVCAGMTPNASTETKAIDTITISTTGDATDFGELTEARLGLNLLIKNSWNFPYWIESQ